MRLALIISLFLAASGHTYADTIGPDGKKRDCFCRSPEGKSLPVGSMTCLTINGKTVLARCEMVLNNTNWNHIGEGCPVSMAPDEQGPISKALISLQ